MFLSPFTDGKDEYAYKKYLVNAAELAESTLKLAETMVQPSQILSSSGSNHLLRIAALYIRVESEGEMYVISFVATDLARNSPTSAHKQCKRP